MHNDKLKKPHFETKLENNKPIIFFDDVSHYKEKVINYKDQMEYS